MKKLKSYHRPDNLEEALRLLDQKNTAVLAGGTTLVPNLPESIETVVDLQAVGLNQVAVDGDSLTLGAMVRLKTLAEHTAVPALIQTLAHREAPNTFRNISTLGGTLAAADWESELYAALLVHEAVVTVQSTQGERHFSLADEWRLAAGELITAVLVKTSGKTAAERVVRTPADKPIVAVVGRVTQDQLLLAVCGVDQRPLIINPDDLSHLDPPSDFRGSATYRGEMVKILVSRVMRKLA